MTSSAAQDEFDQFIAKNTAPEHDRHPNDGGSDSETASSTLRSDDEERGDSKNGTTGVGRSRGIRSAKGRAALDSDEDFDDLDDDEDGPHTSSRTDGVGDMKAAARYFLPSRHHLSDANTGPKGVIADAYAFEHARKKRSSFFSPSLKKTVDDGDSLDASDEDDFMKQWRQSRLQELRNQEGKRRVSPPGGRRWGTLQTVDGEGYLDAVERSGRDVVVLVYIYDDDSEVSNMIEQMIRQLARSHTATHFVRLHYEEAEMEGAGVPALLAYRNGDKFAGLVPLVDELPDDAELSAETLQVLLQRHQML